jgi:hypothetical protein
MQRPLTYICVKFRKCMGYMSTQSAYKFGKINAGTFRLDFL